MSWWVPLENLQILVLFTHARATETDYQSCSVKKVFLKISQNSPENACAKASFLVKLQAKTCNFLKKETLVQLLSGEYWEISQEHLFYGTPPMAASGVLTRLIFWVSHSMVLMVFSNSVNLCNWSLNPLYLLTNSYTIYTNLTYGGYINLSLHISVVN